MGMIKIPKASQIFFDTEYKEIFETGNLAEGKWNKILARWARNYTGAQFSTPCNSNGAGLLAILNILRSKYGKKKIFIQGNTMYGVKTTAITSGLEFIGAVDCSLDYLMPSFEQFLDFARKLEKPSECVFLITHIGGWVNPDIELIADYCDIHNIALLEDCAHSLGATLREKHSGLYGLAGVYSLYATKAIPAGEGGLVVTNNEILHSQIEKYAIYDRFDQELDLGVNIRMSEISALLSFSVCKEIEEIISNKHEIASQYVSACEEYNWEFIHPTSNGQRSNLYKFILKVSLGSAKERFENIKLRTSPVYDYQLGRDVEEIGERHICLPIWYGLETEKINAILSELAQ
ncbi:DegT/DnrJ/EryC1/StrS family aminotransferase [Planktomarina sp.]|nr:DegT/DnrJ/EryC1/StrS family aminotransferase [Planktomarina sp.]